MTCPQCGKNSDLTWRLYFRAPRGKFACPRCAARLTSTHRWFYWALIVPYAGVLIALARSGLLGIAIAGLLAMLPLDRYLENRSGRLDVDTGPGGGGEDAR
ncbi:MAG: hypothetical protein AB1505_34030 [Candidatus Latescibacterota bacterium]